MIFIVSREILAILHNSRLEGNFQLETVIEGLIMERHWFKLIYSFFSETENRRKHP